MPTRINGTRRKQPLAPEPASEWQHVTAFVLGRLRDINTRFSEIHKHGIAAMRAEKYEVVADVIATERALVTECSELVDQQRAMFRVPTQKHQSS